MAGVGSFPADGGGTSSFLYEAMTLGRASSSMVSPAGSKMPRTNSSPSSSASTPASPPCTRQDGMVRPVGTGDNGIRCTATCEGIRGSAAPRELFLFGRLA